MIERKLQRPLPLFAGSSVWMEVTNETGSWKSETVGIKPEAMSAGFDATVLNFRFLGSFFSVQISFIAELHSHEGWLLFIISKSRVNGSSFLKVAIFDLWLPVLFKGVGVGVTEMLDSENGSPLELFYYNHVRWPCFQPPSVSKAPPCPRSIEPPPISKVQRRQNSLTMSHSRG